MQQKSMPILEARVNAVGGDDECCTCGRRKLRSQGTTETYIVDTQRWVCSDCSFRIDAELASFAHDPGNRPSCKRRFKGDIFDAYLGLCPECGGCDGLKNIGRNHWCYCARHGLKWWAGENFFDDWRGESREDWHQNFLFLKRFRKCDPASPEPNRRERLVQWLRGWKRLFGQHPVAVVDDEIPF